MLSSVLSANARDYVVKPGIAFDKYQSVLWIYIPSIRPLYGILEMTRRSSGQHYYLQSAGSCNVDVFPVCLDNVAFITPFTWIFVPE